MTTWYGDEEEALGMISAGDAEVESQEFDARLKDDGRPKDDGWFEYTDSTGSVTVWSDDDLRVVKIRVSNRWRERTRKSSLEAALLEALRSRWTEVPPPTMPHAGVVDMGQPFDVLRMLEPDYFDVAEHNRLMSDTLDMLDRAAALPAEAFTPTEVFEPPRGSSAHGRITCTLDGQRMVNEITMEPTWLADVGAESLTSSLMEAINAAYASWHPPRYAYSAEAEAFRAQLDDVTQRSFNMVGLVLARDGNNK